MEVSIIIPAHNEASVIRKSLLPLLPGIESGEIELIVVCNGCTDATADIVRNCSSRIICIETPIASKTQALNLGERKAHYFPRIYLDADVVLSASAVYGIAAILEQGIWLAAAPALMMDYTGSSWFVRSYYEIWLQLPYVIAGMIGTGAFALSEKGRARFSEFPDIIADDGYVRAIFKENERVSVSHSKVFVRAPANLKGLLKIKTRSRLGRYELAARFPCLLQNERKDYSRGILALLKRPGNWPKLPVYFSVNIASRICAKKKYSKQGYNGWERDESSRKE